MKRPTWATVVGVLGIIFGCLGILGAGQEMMMPTIIKFQKNMFSQMEDFIQKEMEKEKFGPVDDESSSEIANSKRYNNHELPFEMFKSFQKMMDFPKWYNTWCVISGFFKLIISGLLLFAAISMLQLKLFSINLFYWTTGSGIVLASLKGILAFFAAPFLGFIMMSAGLFGIVIDIVLFIVVITGDKEAFGLKMPFTLTY